MIDSIRIGAQFFLPFALNYAIQASSLDVRIRQIVVGAGFTASGIALLRSQNRRWATTLAGCAFTCYGLAHIAMGIFELSKPIPCADRITMAKERLLSCPQGQTLWNEVGKQGDFTVRCAPHNEVPFGAITRIDSREILLSEKLPLRHLPQSLLFELLELNNLDQSKLRTALYDNPCNLKMDEFVREIIKIEYESSKAISQITEKCVNNGFWDRNMKQFADVEIRNWNSFEEYYQAQSWDSNAQAYRSHWLRICRKPS